MKQHHFYTVFTENLSLLLLEKATQEELLGGQYLITDDLESKWKQIAPEYMADAVSEVEKFPTVAVAWAAYLGMGVAVYWDTNWDLHGPSDMTYVSLREPRGFDAMDEYIMDKLMNMQVGSPQFDKIESFLRKSASTAIAFIQKEEIPPASVEAYQIFADAVQVFFNLGASIALHHLGYKFHKT